jgi:hypothetical protein
LWLIDGYNVLRTSFSRATEEAAAGNPSPGSSDRERSDGDVQRGWWTEPRRRALVELVGRACDSESAVWVVFDGPRDADGETGADESEKDMGTEDRTGSGREANDKPRVIFAVSADDWIVQTVKSRGAIDRNDAPRTAEPNRTIVVTADRPLAGRSRHHGAEITSPADFVSRCLSAPAIRK